MDRKIYRGTWLVTICFVATAAAYLILVFLPGRRAMGELRDELSRRESYLAQNASLPQTLATARQEVKKAEAYHVDWKGRAPVEGQLSSLYGKIHELTKAAGTVTTRFDPKPVQTHERLREIPVTMACTGTFAQTFELLKSLESLPQTIWIDAVQIRKASETKETAMCEVSLVVFADNPENSDYVKQSN